MCKIHRIKLEERGYDERSLHLDLKSKEEQLILHVYDKCMHKFKYRIRKQERCARILEAIQAKKPEAPQSLQEPLTSLVNALQTIHDWSQETNSIMNSSNITEIHKACLQVEAVSHQDETKAYLTSLECKYTHHKYTKNTLACHNIHF